MASRKVEWSVGDLFLVRTADGQHVLGQIVGCEPSVLNSVSVAFFDQRFPSPEVASAGAEPDPSKAFSIVFSTRDLLDSGVWGVIGRREVGIPRSLLPFESLRANGFVGAKVIGSGNLITLLNAYYGLAPWDSFHDPEYLDRLLVNPAAKPKHVVLKRRPMR